MRSPRYVLISILQSVQNFQNVPIRFGYKPFSIPILRKATAITIQFLYFHYQQSTIQVSVHVLAMYTRNFFFVRPFPIISTQACKAPTTQSTDPRACNPQHPQYRLGCTQGMHEELVHIYRFWTPQDLEWKNSLNSLGTVQTSDELFSALPPVKAAILCL